MLRHLLYTCEATVGLAVYDLALLIGKFQLLHAMTRRCPIARRTFGAAAVVQLCDAVDEAAVFYPRRTYCLQRSSVATWLLRLHGVPASLVIAYRPAPLESHAWVEVANQVVNDRPQYKTHFLVIDRL